MIRVQFFAVTALALLVSSAARGQVSFNLLPVDLIAQENGSWCWAASGQMVMRYFSLNVPQCAEATCQFGRGVQTNCCKKPISWQCVQPGQVVIDCYGFTFQQNDQATPMKKAEIADEIEIRNTPWIINPYCATETICGPWGHVMVGVGYFWAFRDAALDIFLVAVNDPYPDGQGSFYFEMYHDYESGCWWANGTCEGYAEGFDIHQIEFDSKSKGAVVHLDTEVATLASDEVKQVINGDPDPNREASISWKLFRGLINITTASRLGFESTDSRDSGRLLPAVQQFDVSLSALRSWNKGEAEIVLKRSPSLIVPVAIGERMRASVRLRQEGILWRLSAFGNPEFTAAWDRAHRAGGEFIVFVEGLELPFAGKNDGPNGLRLIPLTTNPEFKLKEGEEKAASIVFSDLRDAARAYRGNGASLILQKLR